MKRIAFTFITAIACCAAFAQNQPVPYVEYGREEKSTHYEIPGKATEDTKTEAPKAQTSRPKDSILVLPNTIAFHPMQMVDGTLALSYERADKKRDKALRITIGYSKLDQTNYYSPSIQDFEQVYGEVALKLFLTRKKKMAPVGLYAAPYFQYRRATFDYHYKESTYYSTSDTTFSNLSSFSLGGGVMLGYNIIVLEMISLDIYSGVGIQSVNGDYRIEYQGSNIKPLDSGFFWNNGPIFKLGASIGVNF